MASIQSDPPIISDHKQIKRVKVTQSLGLIIDKTSTWDEQLTIITKKVNNGLNILRRIFGGLGTTLGNKLQQLQNKAVRIIYKE